MRAAVAILLALVAGPVAAQDELRPTPAYFAEAVFDMSTAQALARSCSSISVDPDAAAERASALLAALAEDGFSTDTPFAEMREPDAAIRDLQQDFVGRYGLQQPDEARVCAVAGEEIDAGTGVGLLLTRGQG
jgi:hypothetical protein